MDDYYIAFRTKDVVPKGSIVALKVSIGTEIHTDMNQQFDLGLCDHPLYPDLVEYVRSNPGPVKGPKRKGGK